MKLDIKKIALILAASIFAFAGAFAEEEEASLADATMARRAEAFKKAKLVLDNLGDHEVQVEFKDKKGKARKFNRNETAEIKNMESVDISAWKKGGPKPAQGASIKLEGSRMSIVDRINKAAEELRRQGVSINAKEDGDTLVITIKKEAGSQSAMDREKAAKDASQQAQKEAMSRQ